MGQVLRDSPGRKPGKAKTGGRQPGSKNRRTLELLTAVAKECGDDFDPVVKLCALAARELKSLDKNAACDDALWRRAGEGDKDARKEVAERLTASKVFAAEVLAKAAPYIRARLTAQQVSIAEESATCGVLLIPARQSPEEWEQDGH